MTTRLQPDAPAWAYAALHTVPWVVVRRADVSAPDLVPVGIRGATRSHRHALTVPLSSISATVTPEHLAKADHGATRGLPALDALQLVRRHMSRGALAWGPTGSVGFELATGTESVTPDSDLDLILRAPHPIDAALLRELASVGDVVVTSPVRVDCQIATPAGAIALTELLDCQPHVMLKTCAGPRLVPRAEVLA